MSPALFRLLVAVAGLWVGTGAGDRAPVWGLVAAGMGATAMLALRRSGAMRIAGLAVACLCLGSFAGRLSSAPTPVSEMASRVPHCALAGRILEDDGKLGMLVSADRLRCGGRAVTRAGTVVSDDPGGQPGGGIRGTGWLIPFRTSGFDAARSRTGAGASFAFDGRPSITGPASGPLALAAAIRSGLRRSSSGLDPDTSSLLSGLTVGDTKDLSSQVTDELRRAGLSHLVAVSGSNVAIVLAAVMGCFRGLGLRTRVVAGLGGLVLYVLVTGPDASVLRAAAMGAVALAALLGGRRAQPLNAMALGLIAILALRPMLATSVGLALSAAATAGIVLFSPMLMDPLRRLPRPVALVAAATVSAQIAVAPLLLVTFGQLSMVSPVANLLAEAAVAPATILGLAGGCIGAVDASLGEACAHLAAPFVAWILWVGRTFGSPGWAALQVPHWTGAAAAIPVAGWAVRVLWRGHCP